MRAIFILFVGLSVKSFAIPSAKIIVGTVANNVFLQGTLVESNSSLDIAIAGYGFLPLRSINGKIVFTRLGKLGMDKEGDLEHIPSSLKVLTTNKTGKLEKISLKNFATRQSKKNRNRLATLTNIRINREGKIEGAYSDGQLVVIGQIKLAAFENVRNLKVIDEKKFLLTSNRLTGELAFLSPGEHPAGLIYDRYIESLSIEDYKKQLR